MISSNDRKPSVKVAGYLEKKSKMRVVCRWKKLWFVLEGRLLLYYKSQLEYLSLSPCRGTVNLGLAASVVPGKSHEIIVSTRSNTVSLRALNRPDHDVWLQALIDAMCLPNSSHTLCCSKPVHHFRYSTGVLEGSENMTERTQQLTGQANTLSARLTSSHNHKYSKDNFMYGSNSGKHSAHKFIDKHTESDNEIDRGKFQTQEFATSSCRYNGTDSKHNTVDNGLDKLTKKFSKIAVSDTSIPGKFRLTSNESEKSEILRRSASVENDFIRYSENIYESVKEMDTDSKEIIPQKRKIMETIKRSDSDRILSRRGTIQREFRSEQKIKTSCENSPVFRHKRDKLPLILNTNKLRSPDYKSVPSELKMEDYRLKGMKLTALHNETNMRRFYNKDVKSDTDLSVKKQSFRQSGSCDAITMNKPKDIFIQKEDTSRFTDELNKFRAKMLKDTEIMKTCNVKPAKARRSNSLLRRFSRESSKESYDSGMESGSTPKKRSLSFLKKMWKKKERKWDEDEEEEEDDSFSTNPNPLAEMQGPNSDIEDIGHYTGIDLHRNYEVPRPEPPPDYDEVNISSGSDTEPPQLPPRHHKTSTKRPPSPWHDIPTNNRPIDQEPPALPQKLRNSQKKGSNNLDFLLHDDLVDNDSSGLKFLFREDSATDIYKNISGDLGEMLSKLSELNRTPLQNYHYFADDHSYISGSSRKDENGDPDYDVPRPHASLMATLRKESSSTDTIPATHFFSHYEDSLDPPHIRDDYERLTMAPDSLECDPWSLSNEGDMQNEGWGKYAMTTNTLSIEPTTYTQDSLYQDSLNTTLNNNRDDCIPFHKGFLKLYS